MLRVETILKESPIHGRGCFAARTIRAGRGVWRFNPELDRVVNRFEASVQENQISYCNPAKPDKLVICGDLAAYMNFSDTPNLIFGTNEVDGELDLIAAREIAEGEELTVGLETDCDGARKLRLQPKIAEALEFVERAWKATKVPANPVLYFSGGKDSVAMLHLLRTHGMRCPIIMHREPWQTHKYAFAEKLIRSWKLTVFDYPPLKVGLWQGKGIVAFTNFYQIGGKANVPRLLALPKNVIETDDQGALCARFDILSRPVGTFTYPWTLAMIGHKSSDSDQIAGRVPLAASFVNNEESAGPNLCFPLMNWTDEDVWDYTEQYGLPVQTDRYRDRKELPDKTNNSDYFTACIRCVDRREEGEVHCPRFGRKIANISDQVEYEDLRPAYILPE